MHLITFRAALYINDDFYFKLLLHGNKFTILLHFRKKYSKLTKWHPLDLSIDTLEQNGIDDIKNLLQNVAQYGIQNVFVVHSASHWKTYLNMAAKELRFQSGYPKSRFAQCFSHGQSGAMGFEKEYHKSELLQSHQDVHDSHIMLLVKFHHLVKVMSSRFLHYKVTIFFFSLFFRSK